MVSPARIFPALLALAAPLFVQLLWLFTNTQLPISDATGSLLAAYQLSQKALSGDWADFLSGLYFMRDWRPTSLCLVQMPFCLISGGNLMFTAAAMTFTSTVFSLVYIYRLLRLTLSPYPAALGTTMLGLMPVVQWPATFFGFTETPFLAASLASFYYLLRCEDFSHRKYSFCMAGTAILAFTLRPIETLFHFVPLLAFCSWRAKGRGKLSGAELYTTLTFCSLCVSVLLIAGWWPHGLFVFPESAIFNEALQGQLFTYVCLAVWVATLLLVIFLFLRAVWRPVIMRHSCYLPAVGLIAIGVALWYLPFMTELVQWIYITNLGELSNIVAPRSAGEKISFFVMAVGIIPLASITVLAALAYKRASPLFALLAVIPIPLVTPFLSCQYSQRKMTVLFTCLLIVLLSLALQQGKLQKLRVGLIALLAALQCAGLAWVSSGERHTPMLQQMIGLSLVYPDHVTARPNPHDTLFAFISESGRRHGYHSIALPILAGDFVPRIADPFLLHTLTEIRTPEIRAVFPHITHETAGLYSHLRALLGGDAFIVIPEKALTHTPEEAAHYRELSDHAFLPSDKTAYALLALHTEGKLETLGAYKRDCRVIAPTKVEACIYDYKR